MKHFALLLIAAPCLACAQVTCQVIGQFTYCSDGTRYQRIGNTIYETAPSRPAAPPISDTLLDSLARGVTPLQIPPPQSRPAMPARPGGVDPQAVCGYDAYGRYGCR